LKDWNQDATIPKADLTIPTGNYLQIWFNDKDNAALVASGAAATGWYKAGNTAEKKVIYSYKKKLCDPTLPADLTKEKWVSEADDKVKAKAVSDQMDECNNFRTIIWKDATHAAFAVKGHWVVAWI